MARDRRKFEDDFIFVRTGLEAFFDRGPVQKTLDLINEVGITGWEKWWQVEFAAWLSDSEAVGDWVMEEVFLTDLRRNRTKDWITIDIGFRMKGFSSKEILFLELKQHEDWRRCLENMLKDVEKVESRQTYSENGLTIRNFFAVGVYLTGETTKKTVHDYIEQRAGEIDMPFERAHIFTKFIQNTPFSVTAF